MRPTVGFVVHHSKSHSFFHAVQKVNSLAEFVVGSHVSDFPSSIKFDCIVACSPAVHPVVEQILLNHLETKWVHSYFAGVDGIKPLIDNVLIPRNITLTNARGAYSHSLAEYCMMCMLYFNKQVPRLQSTNSARNWDSFQMMELRGKTLCLIGYGHISKATAQMAKVFGMNITAVRRGASNLDGDGLASKIYSSSEPDWYIKALPEADFVLSTLPGTADTHHFLSKREFTVFKEGGILISIGRGRVINEADLIEAIKCGNIAGAAMDVFEKEPLPKESELWGLGNDKVLLSYHNADKVSASDEDAIGVFMENLNAYVNNEQFVTLVDKNSGY